jgi:hypothetical protein
MVAIGQQPSGHGGHPPPHTDSAGRARKFKAAGFTPLAHLCHLSRVSAEPGYIYIRLRVFVTTLHGARSLGRGYTVADPYSSGAFVQTERGNL